jgi:DNA replication and repair protein RecF
MIKNLRLVNFRNYSELNLNFSNRKIVFTGTNGQGKTNILEAVYFLSILRSFRTSSIKAMTRISAPGFYIAAEIEHPSLTWSKKLEIEYESRRILKIDGNSVSKASHFITNLKTVVFSPADIEIITSTSAVRRRFINIFASNLVPGYLNALSEYLEALKNRNLMLKSGASEYEFRAYEQIIAQQGAFIIKTRKKIFSLLTDEMVKTYKSINKNITSFNLKYLPDPAGNAGTESYLEKLALSRDKDKNKGYTSYGPHCDDFELILNGKHLRHFGSNGQCRLAAICLKMAAVAVLNSENFQNNDNIIVLIDDVTGDLDEKTKKAFFMTVETTEQTFFTFTEKPQSSLFSNASFYKVDNGSVTEIS